MDLLKKAPLEYLRHKIGPNVELVEFEKFPRGSSRETWFVGYREGPGQPVKNMTFRADLPTGSTIPTSLEQEYFMYDRLGRTDVPVAKALWWEEDAAWTNRPFFAREKVEGNWELPDFVNPDPKFDEYRIEISKEHMRKLAIIHNVDWRAAGFDERLVAPSGPEDCGANSIRLLESQLSTFQQEPLPIFIAGVAALKRKAPVAPCVSLGKGTNGLGEEVFRDGKIVAMSDWEEAYIGDPAKDFAHMQNFAPEIERSGKKIWGLEHALEYYRSVGGPAVTVEAVRFYQAVSFLGMTMYGHRAAVACTQPDANVRQLWTGTEVLNLGKRLIASVIGIGPAIPAERFLELNETVG